MSVTPCWLHPAAFIVCFVSILLSQYVLYLSMPELSTVMPSCNKDNFATSLTANKPLPATPAKKATDNEGVIIDDMMLITVLKEQQAERNLANNSWKGCIWNAAKECDLAGSELFTRGAPQSPKGCHGHWDSLCILILVQSIIETYRMPYQTFPESVTQSISESEDVLFRLFEWQGWY